MSELQQYYEAFRTGYWAQEDAAQCLCHGSGWALSEVDTWHECPRHFQGQAHPESPEPVAYVVSALLNSSRYAVALRTDDGTPKTLEQARALSRTYQKNGWKGVKLSRIRGQEAIEGAEMQIERVAEWGSDFDPGE